MEPNLEKLNRIVAEYLNWREEPFNSHIKMWYTSKDTNIINDDSGTWYELKNMKFHKSYDWLMSLWNKKLKKELELLHRKEFGNEASYIRMKIALTIANSETPLECLEVMCEAINLCKNNK